MTLNPSLFEIRAGVYDIKNKGEGVRYQPVNFIVEPSFDRERLFHDIAVIRVSNFKNTSMYLHLIRALGCPMRDSPHF